MPGAPFARPPAASALAVRTDIRCSCGMRGYPSPRLPPDPPTDPPAGQSAARLVPGALPGAGGGCSAVDRADFVHGSSVVRRVTCSTGAQGRVHTGSAPPTAALAAGSLGLSTADEDGLADRWLRDTFPDMDESLTDRLVSTDVSTLNGAELLAHLDAVQQHLRNLQKTQLALLDENPEIVEQRPELRAQLAQLRTLDLDDVSGS